MSDKTQESVSRLETLKSGGRIDRTAELIQNGHPFLDALNVSPDMVLRCLEKSPNALESQDLPAPQLEAIVRTVTRPPMIVRDNKVDFRPLPSPDFPDDVEGMIRDTEYLLPSVGRVEFINHDMSWGGTAWVVQEEDADHFLVCTNRHVASIVARRSWRGGGVFMRTPFSNVTYGAAVDFNEEVTARAADARVAPILDFTYLADDAAADVAIGRIRKPQGFHVTALELADDDPRTDDLVAVVGYPAYDSRNDKTDMDRYFQGLYEVKRYAPGKVLSSGNGVVLSHDCTTLGGNSGSPVIGLEDGKVVGLHFAGVYGVGNSAVRASTLKSLLRGERPVQASLVDSESVTERPDGEHDADHFTGREGYDPAFLDGFTVPLPSVSAAGHNLAEPTDALPGREHELRYQHFSVLYCEARKSPVVTAVNIDGEQSKRIKRGRDKWFFDLRIPKVVQLGKADFLGDLDRGHMVRREDPNWGSQDTAERANFDTFHYTNASPQHSRLNQNRGTWAGLEIHILNSTRTHDFRATVFTGPVLDDRDPPFDEIGVPLPIEYWKVVVMRAKNDDGSHRLHATAYLLSQGRLIQDYLQQRGTNEGLEGFMFGEYKTFQISIETLEKATKFDFGDLRNHDPLHARAGDLEFPTQTPLFQEISDLDTIIL